MHVCNNSVNACVHCLLIKLDEALLQCWEVSVFSSGIRYYKFRMVFGIPWYLIKLELQHKNCIVGTFDNNKIYISLVS